MDLSHLIALSDRYSAENRDCGENLPRLTVYRRTAPGGHEAMIYDPVVCLILQGSKETSVGDQHVILQPGDALLVSHDTPVMSRITQASAEKPYIAVILSLDLGLARGLYSQLTDVPVPATATGPFSKGPADPSWLAPLARYFELIDNPMDEKVLGSSILREIHYRLLLAPIGQMLRHLLVTDSHANRIAKAILKMRNEFSSPLSVADLAKTAGMSTSSFHEHFKSVTRTTPLQYQKDLRLIAARDLLVRQGRPVSEAAFSVGYESPTHFSRDYTRKFGFPPSRDIRDTTAVPESA